jgi:hypothetical protein
MPCGHSITTTLVWPSHEKIFGSHQINLRKAVLYYRNGRNGSKTLMYHHGVENSESAQPQYLHFVTHQILCQPSNFQTGMPDNNEHEQWKPAYGPSDKDMLGSWPHNWKCHVVSLCLQYATQLQNRFEAPPITKMAKIKKEDDKIKL